MRMSKTAKKKIVCCCIILILVLVMIFVGLPILESSLYSGNDSGDVPVSKTITRDGVDYFPRQDITVMMVLGIASQDAAADSSKYDHTGLCDMAMLLIFDQTNEHLRILSLNPDTVMHMSTSGTGETQTEPVSTPLALVHSYGSDPEDSCEHTRKTVSDFLYGIEIDHYLALDLEAIGLLNDAVGGVTVTVEDDFSQVDPSIEKGIVTLRGDQAITYIRSLQNMGDQANASRMKRHQQYVQGFLKAFRAKAQEDTGFLLSAFEEASPYLVSDSSVLTLAGFVTRYSEYDLVEIVSPEGERILNTERTEFHADETQLDALILRLFYAPK